MFQAHCLYWHLNSDLFVMIIVINCLCPELFMVYKNDHETALSISITIFISV